MKFLCGIADSFIYVVSRMGVTGVSGALNSKLPDLVEKVHTYSKGKPAAVGFGISTREDFVNVGKVTEGVVIGSQIITTLANASPGQGAQKVEEYCSEITGRKVGRHTVTNGVKHVMEKEEEEKEAMQPNGDAAHPDEVIREGEGVNGPGLADQLEALNMNGGDAAVPSRFGEFGGQYVPESLMVSTFPSNLSPLGLAIEILSYVRKDMSLPRNIICSLIQASKRSTLTPKCTQDCLAELERGFNEAKEDPKFWEEYRSYYPYMGRPGHLHQAERLTEHAGGARIWLKREDLNHTGSHKINNALGQILVARRLGKTRIIAETGAGQHGVATATVCAKFGMPCTIYMGGEVGLLSHLPESGNADSDFYYRMSGVRPSMSFASSSSVPRWFPLRQVRL